MGSRVPDRSELHGDAGFYISEPEFKDASMETQDLLVITGRDLEIQIELLDDSPN